MAIEVTRNWTASRLSKGVSAHESFDVSGVTQMIDALNANGPPFGAVPRHLNTHAEDTTLFAMAPVVQIMTPGTYFRVEVDYGPLGLTLGIAPPNPLDEPPKYSWGDEEETEAVDVDLLGNPLTTSNGDAIDPPPELTLTSKIIRVTKWVREFDLSLARDFELRTNDDPVQIPLCSSGEIPKSCLLCRSICPITEYDERATAIQVQFVFALRFFGWRWRFLDVGHRGWYKDTDDGILKMANFVSKVDKKEMDRVRLNGKGKPYVKDSVDLSTAAKTPIEIGKPTGAEIEDTGKAVFLKYFKYPGAAFSGLRIFP